MNSNAFTFTSSNTLIIQVQQPENKYYSQLQAWPGALTRRYNTFKLYSFSMLRGNQPMLFLKNKLIKNATLQQIWFISRNKGANGLYPFCEL